jgi:hypothetical protein
MLALKIEKQQKDKEDSPCLSCLMQGKNKETKTKGQGSRGYLNAFAVRGKSGLWRKPENFVKESVMVPLIIDGPVLVEG